jgi:hypothetical protein
MEVWCGWGATEERIAFVALIHPRTAASGWADPVAYPVLLDWSRPHFGGQRPWFLCPAQRDGRWCGRRVRVLYRPLGAACFACRECHRLSYLSRQCSGAIEYEGWTRRLAAEDAFARAMRSRCGWRRRARALARLDKSWPGFERWGAKLAARQARRRRA